MYINGIGERAGNASLEELVMNLKIRNDIYKLDTNIITTEITHTSDLLQSITGSKVQPNKAIVGSNAFSHEAGIHQHGIISKTETYQIINPKSVGGTGNNIILGKHSGKHALKNKLIKLGYNVSNNELNNIFRKFKVLAEKKKFLYDVDIKALITKNTTSVKPRYKLMDYLIITTKGKESKAIIKIEDNKKIKEFLGLGKGPIDATFDALAKFYSEKIILEDFNISSIIENKDILGKTNLKISYGNKTYIGEGISYDIVKSSILAYINAMNYLENSKERIIA